MASEPSWEDPEKGGGHAEPDLSGQPATSFPHPDVVHDSVRDFYRENGVNPGRTGCDLALKGGEMIAEPSAGKEHVEILAGGVEEQVGIRVSDEPELGVADGGELRSWFIPKCCRCRTCHRPIGSMARGNRPDHFTS